MKNMPQQIGGILVSTHEHLKVVDCVGTAYYVAFIATIIIFIFT